MLKKSPNYLLIYLFVCEPKKKIIETLILLCCIHDNVKLMSAFSNLSFVKQYH